MFDSGSRFPRTASLPYSDLHREAGIIRGTTWRQLTSTRSRANQHCPSTPYRTYDIVEPGLAAEGPDGNESEMNASAREPVVEVRDQDFRLKPSADLFTEWVRVATGLKTGFESL